MQNTEKNLENGNLFPTTQNAIQTYVNSKEQFPVNFDEFWQWVGYARKDAAKRTLEANFKIGIDYDLLHNKVEQVSGAKWIDKIMLSTDCAKSFAMLAQTDKGKEVRYYFLDCEKKLIQLQQNPQHQLLPAEIQKILFRMSFLETENAKHHEFQEKMTKTVSHLVNVMDNMPYNPHKKAEPLNTYYVYFAFNPDNNHTKIGRSHEPEARLKAFRAISPRVTIELIINVSDIKTSCDLETFLHTLFARKHQSGEIFELSKTDFKILELLKDAIESLT